MSIFNDSRRYSNDPDEYEEWKAEVAWECRRDNYQVSEYYEPEDLVIDLEGEDDVDSI